MYSRLAWNSPVQLKMASNFLSSCLPVPRAEGTGGHLADGALGMNGQVLSQQSYVPSPIMAIILDEIKHS